MRHLFGNLDEIFNSLALEVKTCTNNHWLSFLDTKVISENFFLAWVLAVFFQINPIWNSNDWCGHPIRLNQFFRILRWRNHVISLLIHVGQIFSKKWGQKVRTDEWILKVFTCRMTMHDDLLTTTFCCMQQHQTAWSISIDMNNIIITQDVCCIGNPRQV